MTRKDLETIIGNRGLYKIHYYNTIDIFIPIWKFVFFNKNRLDEIKPICIKINIHMLSLKQHFTVNSVEELP